MGLASDLMEFAESHLGGVFVPFCAIRQRCWTSAVRRGRSVSRGMGWWKGAGHPLAIEVRCKCLQLASELRIGHLKLRRRPKDPPSVRDEHLWQI